MKLNLVERRKAAADHLLRPIEFKEGATLEQKVAEIIERRKIVVACYPFLKIDERHRADEWLINQPRTSDPEFQPAQTEGPTPELPTTAEPRINDGFQPRKHHLRR